MTDSVKWYYRRWFVYLLLAVVGPLALPLLWLSPSFSKKGKWVLTILLIVLTLYLMVATQQLVHLFKQYGGT